MKAYGGILAGGIGSRMATKDGVPKQFMKIGGVPVIVRTLRRFFECNEIERIVVAMHSAWRDFATDLFDEYQIDRTRLEMVDGGATRFDSLENLARGCLAAAERSGESEEVLMVNHDCARPFVTVDILKRNIRCALEYDMVTTSVPTIDTVLISEDGKTGDRVPERSTVFCDQGPQTVKVRQFLSLVKRLAPGERARYMEAGRLYLDKGLRVGIVPGDRMNFKLTTLFDVAMAEMLLKEEMK